MVKNYIFIFIFLMIGIMLLPATPVSGLDPGDLIRGSGPAVYFLGDDNKRYAFPSSRIYFTWYEDFSNVTVVSDSTLASYLLGGNVTYKPGVKMVKIDSTPKVYAVDNGAYLRWVTTEELAIELYGPNWNKNVDDIPVTFFFDYIIGSHINIKTDFNVNTVQNNSIDINDERTRWKAARLQVIADANKTPEVEEVPDQIADVPTVIILSESSVTGTQVQIKWSSVGVADLKYFLVYKGTSGAVTATNTGIYTDNQVATSTTYTYYIKAVDVYGEDMATSNTLSVTTPDS